MNNTDYANISSENVKFLLLSSKMSIRQLAEKINIAPTTLNDSLKSKKGLAIDYLIKIADYFNVTVNDLCSDTFNKTNSSSVNNNEIELINKFRLLDTQSQELVLMVVNKELERKLNKNLKN